MMDNNPRVLTVKNLHVTFHTEDGLVRAVQDVSFEITHGKTLALVGESGCGKSVTSLAIMRLIPDPPGKITAGQILLDSKNLLELPEKQMRSIRGNEIAMIFQEPMTSLNQVNTVGDQIVEAIELHQNLKGPAAWEKTVEMFRQVGISDPARRVNEYPHQMSGGMRQRVMIAMALSCDPKLLIADEPTTALDVTIQAQILELLRELQQKNRMSILLITHDLGVVAENAHEVVVMYASRIMEKSPVGPIFENPLHPYTKGLLKSLPRLGKKKDRLDVIPGSVPDPLHFPAGCKFHPRCPYCKGPDDLCCTREPSLEEILPGRFAACWKAKELLEK